MSRRAWLAAAALAWAAVSGPAHSNDGALPKTGFLQVSDDVCGGGNRGEDGVEWLSDHSAQYRLHLQLNSRESITPGPVDIDVTPGKVVAYVRVHVYEPKDGEPVPTCVRPVTLNLLVTPIARGNYVWQFLRGTRSEILARRAAAEASSPQNAAVPQASAAPAEAAAPDDDASPDPAAEPQD